MGINIIKGDSCEATLEFVDAEEQCNSVLLGWCAE
jgi:hypothetical protein